MNILLLLLYLLSAIIIVQATIRQYYIAAEEIDWDYAPQQWDNLRDQPLNQSYIARLYTTHNATRLGTIYRKVVYQQYTDNTFTIPITHDRSLGFLGPIIKAEIGDRIQIDFLNKASQPCSLHPHTIELTNSSLAGKSVAPQHGYHYVWDIPTTVNMPENQSSILWVYLSKHDPLVDLNAGLVGPIVIYKQGYLVKPSPYSMSATLPGVQEIFTMMMTTDEGLSNYLKKTAELQQNYYHENDNNDNNDPINQSSPSTYFDVNQLDHLIKTDDLFMESNRMYHVNGYIYNNNKDIRIYYGQPVRWYIIAFGLEDDDAHTAHWHGASVLYHGHRVDVVDLMPVSFEVVDMVPDNEGQWLFHCHVASHFDAGMSAFYQVEKLEYTGEEGWDV